jgi:hypothetical protein
MEATFAYLEPSLLHHPTGTKRKTEKKTSSGIDVHSICKSRYAQPNRRKNTPRRQNLYIYHLLTIWKVIYKLLYSLARAHHHHSYLYIKSISHHDTGQIKIQARVVSTHRDATGIPINF